MRTHKIIVGAALAIALQGPVFGQGVAILNATTYREQGDLIKAKEFIDKAVLHEKTSTSAKAWYYKGLIYFDLANAQKPEGVDGYKVAAEAWDKVAKLDKPKGEWVTEAEKHKHNLWIGLYNTGLKRGEENKDEEAYQYFELAHSVKSPSDTLYNYAYNAAKNLAYTNKNYPQLKKYLLQEVENTNNPQIFNNLSAIYQLEQAPEKALEIVQKGRVKFPDNLALMNEEINLFVTLKRLDEAQKKTEDAVKLDPNNAVLLYILGYTYDKNGEYSKAIDSYSKSLSINPDNYEATFALGRLYFNKGAKLTQDLNMMSTKDYTAIGKKKEAERDDLLRKGLIYFEKCKSVKPEDPDLKSPMADSYRILKIKK